MGLKKTLSLVLLLICPAMLAEPAKRIAIMPANSKFLEIENRVADGLTAQLAGTNGIAIIDRASIDKILKEQNFQNSDRSSLDTAARIGKLVGAGQIVLVQVVNASYTGHQETSGNTPGRGMKEFFTVCPLSVCILNPEGAYCISVLTPALVCSTMWPNAS